MDKSDKTIINISTDNIELGVGGEFKSSDQVVKRFLALASKSDDFDVVLKSTIDGITVQIKCNIE